LDEGDESEAGSVNFFGPASARRPFLSLKPVLPLVNLRRRASFARLDRVEIDADLTALVVGKLMAIHEDTQTIRQLLEDDDDEADEPDDADS